MKPKIIFFGSDRYSQVVLKSLKRDKRFVIIKTIAKADVGVIASFGSIIPPKIISLPKHGILNLHPSLLPKYRGPTPVPTAILAGEQQTGLTIIKIDEKVDHGPIVAQFTEDIRPNDNTETLYKRLFAQGAEVLKTILPAYLEGRIELRPQDHLRATYTKKFSGDDGKIDWQKPAEFLDRFIRAMTPEPGAWTLLRPDGRRGFAGQAKRLKILKAHLEKEKLIFDQVQLEGKKPVTWKQFQEGYPAAELI